MLIIFKHDAKEKDILSIDDLIKDKGLDVYQVPSRSVHILSVDGEHSYLKSLNIESNAFIEDVIYISKPYKLASREYKKENTVINIDNVEIGTKKICIIAGPCAVESEIQLMKTAEEVKRSGASILRGGAFKPRTSPYSFQGLGEKGLKILKKAGSEFKMPVVTEVLKSEHVELVGKYADIFQIGSRNMQNFELLKKVGRQNKPVLLKRGMSASINEFLMAAEYIMSEGNHNVILCERGIKTFENITRNTLDLSAVPILKQLSHLPVIVDPCHSTGQLSLIEPMSKASIACGCDGLIIEVHVEPEKALSDPKQQLEPERFNDLMKNLKKITPVFERYI